MNEADEPNAPQNPPPIQPIESNIEPEVTDAAQSELPLSLWLKRFFACNPFYLVSVALLLYGCYRISLEPGIFGKESAHLVFNFSSLQAYEILLVVTAIFLARRRIWYDSTLLVGLETLLVLVPFILLTQAALLPDKEMIRAMGLIGGLMAGMRMVGLKRFIGKLNFPRRLVGIGLGVLAVNVALTIVYRMLHENKFGTKLESGPAYETNQYVWMLLLPALCALALTLPRRRPSGESWPERAWIPMGLFGLWVAGTGVHLYCLGYVYDFGLRGELVAPTLWVMAWVLHARVMGVFPKRALESTVETGAFAQRPSPAGEERETIFESPSIDPVVERMMLILPILATFAACWPESSKVFFALTLFNVAIYSRIFLRNRENRLVLNLSLISLAALLAGFPESWGVRLMSDFTREKCMGIAAAGYLLLWSARSADPRIGIFGAFVSGIAALVAGGSQANAIHFAVQVGLIFLLLHSLRWADLQHAGATMVRIVAASLWVAHAVIWTHTSGRPWMPCVAAAIVWAVYIAGSIVRRRWGRRLIPLTATLVMLAGPADMGAGSLETIPIGVLAMVGSFLLFGLGTLAALTRHRWHKSGW